MRHPFKVSLKLYREYILGLGDPLVMTNTIHTYVEIPEFVLVCCSHQTFRVLIHLRADSSHTHSEWTIKFLFPMLLDLGNMGMIAGSRLALISSTSESESPAHG